MTADETRTAGRGLLSITGAKVYFIVASYGIQLLLPRLLGSPEAFGLFSTAMNVASIVNNVLIVSTVQAVSKFVSESDARGPETLRRGLGIQLVLGAGLALVFVAGAGPISGWLLDAQVAPLVRISSSVVFAYALYAAFVGSLNGRRLFQTQAFLDMTFSTLRALGILGAAALGYGALGAMVGFGTAAVVIMSVAALRVGVGGPIRSAETVSVRTWLSFTLPLWLYHGFLNGLMQADLALLKRTVADLGLVAGEAAERAAELASAQVGFYRAAQTFAFVPYQLILSLTFIIFPMVSKAIAEGDREGTRRYVRAAMRFALLFLLSISAPIAGAARGVMRLAYAEAYGVGAGALEFLVFGMAAFALFVIAATILTSAGRPGRAAAAGGIGFTVVIAANLVLVRAAGLDGDMLRAAAVGTSCGTLVALGLAAWLVYAQFRALIQPLTVLRGLVAGGGAYLAAQAVNAAIPSRPGTLAALVVGFFAFLLGLALLRELGKDDLALVRKVLKPTARSG